MTSFFISISRKPIGVITIISCVLLQDLGEISLV